ncbi:MAG TPA: branched-chain amino acid ABC transporter substrate-binding protein [Gaiellaceae bacterium]|nr:branched-chain amino acid ABC transporter substrate-binding protein [Gaiellaceae bacterium]
MRRTTLLSVLALVIGALALLAAGCGGSSSGSTGAAGTGGGGGKTLKIVSDLPLQGSSSAQTETMVNAIKLYLQEQGNKAGNYNITYQSFDDATAAKGEWDEATCAANARKYVEDSSIVGVVGTFNSGCAKIEVPIANEASLAYCSPANTGVGLTHEGPGSEPGEPDKYYPSGARNYTRVVASDDFQGQIDASYMKDKMGVTKVYILDDKETYGKGVADAFEQAAKDIGLTVTGHTGWDSNAQSYKALMTQIKASGADGVYVGGIADLNGGQLVKDKVAVLGDNDTVKLLASDGFVLDSLFDEAGADNINGMYGSAPVLNPEDLTGAGKTFLDAYTAKYGAPEVYTAYSAACAQVLLGAIAASDGSREDITKKLFETNITDGIVGPMAFNANGDPKQGLISIFKAGTAPPWKFVEAKQLSNQ